MTTRDTAPAGSPCWTDLWTSDVEGSRQFYAEVFGWEAQAPSPEFGGYFMFTRDGVPVAGGMGPMPDMPADNTWKMYLQTDDIATTLDAAQRAGGAVRAPAVDVADLGKQAILTDPAGAPLGAWQPGTFPGFTVLNEHGAPSWFELLTPDYAAAVEFYKTVFGWEVQVVSDTPEFRYSTMRDPSGDGELAGIGDASSFLPDSAEAFWSIYWEVESTDNALATIEKLGGSVVEPSEDTPYGRLAIATDPAGAQFKLRTSPS